MLSIFASAIAVRAPRLGYFAAAVKGCLINNKVVVFGECAYIMICLACNLPEISSPKLVFDTLGLHIMGQGYVCAAALPFCFPSIATCWQILQGRLTKCSTELHKRQCVGKNR